MGDWNSLVPQEGEAFPGAVCAPPIWVREQGKGHKKKLTGKLRGSAVNYLGMSHKTAWTLVAPLDM